MEEIVIMLTYGKRTRTRDGTSYSMDHAARRRAKSQLGELAYRYIADRLDFYIIVDRYGETVITIAHRLRRHRAA